MRNYSKPGSAEARMLTQCAKAVAYTLQTYTGDKLDIKLAELKNTYGNYYTRIVNALIEIRSNRVA